MCIACFLVFLCFRRFFKDFFSFVCVSIFRFLYTVFLSWLHFVRNKLYKLYIEGKAVCAHSVRVALNTLLSFYILFTKTSETTVVSL